MTLTWQKQTSALGGEHWSAYSDQLLVGWVLKRADGTLWFDVTLAVHMKHIAKPASGVVPTMEAGQKAIEKAWATWLRYAGLAPPGDADHLRNTLLEVADHLESVTGANERPGSDSHEMVEKARSAAKQF